MKLNIPHFDEASILVFGDVMLDRYWYGSTKRISPEAPVPVVHVGGAKMSPGGAANVALNIVSLGARSTLIGMVGKDPEARELEDKLKFMGVDSDFCQSDNHPTITKLRVLSKHQQLIRIDFENNKDELDSIELIARFKKHLASAKVVVLSDYAKGTLKYAHELIKLAKASNIPVLVDPKSEDFSVYTGATIISPNMKEFEAVVGVCKDEQELELKAKKLLKDFDFEAVLVTRGSEGMTLVRRNHETVTLPTHAKEVFDVTGAGDTVIGVLAACLAAGQDMQDAAILANMAAGIVVGKLGSATVSVPELRRLAQKFTDSHLGVLNESELMEAVNDARAHGEKIVMTNGCFDVLHAGHIHYLEQAKSLGARLIVAVNDDQSVKRLKGESRPLNPLDQRMEVLAALRSVDWVVDFSEDTPARIISQVLPDILVKGGDYKIDEIAGAREVQAAGGEVKVLGFKEGISTTALVRKITRSPSSA